MLITATGYKLLTARLTLLARQLEQIMAEKKAARQKRNSRS